MVKLLIGGKEVKTDEYNQEKYNISSENIQTTCNSTTLGYGSVNATITVTKFWNVSDGSTVGFLEAVKSVDSNKTTIADAVTDHQGNFTLKLSGHAEIALGIDDFVMITSTGGTHILTKEPMGILRRVINGVEYEKMKKANDLVVSPYHELLTRLMIDELSDLFAYVDQSTIVDSTLPNVPSTISGKKISEVISPNMKMDDLNYLLRTAAYHNTSASSLSNRFKAFYAPTANFSQLFFGTNVRQWTTTTKPEMVDNSHVYSPKIIVDDFRGTTEILTYDKDILYAYTGLNTNGSVTKPQSECDTLYNRYRIVLSNEFGLKLNVFGSFRYTKNFVIVPRYTDNSVTTTSNNLFRVLDTIKYDLTDDTREFILFHRRRAVLLSLQMGVDMRKDGGTVVRNTVTNTTTILKKACKFSNLFSESYLFDSNYAPISGNVNNAFNGTSVSIPSNMGLVDLSPLCGLEYASMIKDAGVTNAPTTRAVLAKDSVYFDSTTSGTTDLTSIPAIKLNSVPTTFPNKIFKSTTTVFVDEDGEPLLDENDNPTSNDVIIEAVEDALNNTLFGGRLNVNNTITNDTPHLGTFRELDITNPDVILSSDETLGQAIYDRIFTTLGSTLKEHNVITSKRATGSSWNIDVPLSQDAILSNNNTKFTFSHNELLRAQGISGGIRNFAFKNKNEQVTIGALRGADIFMELTDDKRFIVGDSVIGPSLGFAYYQDEGSALGEQQYSLFVDTESIDLNEVNLNILQFTNLILFLIQIVQNPTSTRSQNYGNNIQETWASIDDYNIFKTLPSDVTTMSIMNSWFANNQTIASGNNRFVIQNSDGIEIPYLFSSELQFGTYYVTNYPVSATDIYNPSTREFTTSAKSIFSDQFMIKWQMFSNEFGSLKLSKAPVVMSRTIDITQKNKIQYFPRLVLKDDNFTSVEVEKLGGNEYIKGDVEFTVSLETDTVGLQKDKYPSIFSNGSPGTLIKQNYAPWDFGEVEVNRNVSIVKSPVGLLSGVFYNTAGSEVEGADGVESLLLQGLLQHEGVVKMIDAYFDSSSYDTNYIKKLTRTGAGEAWVREDLDLSSKGTLLPVIEKKIKDAIKYTGEFSPHKLSDTDISNIYFNKVKNNYAVIGEEEAGPVGFNFSKENLYSIKTLLGQSFVYDGVKIIFTDPDLKATSILSSSLSGQTVGDSPIAGVSLSDIYPVVGSNDIATLLTPYTLGTLPTPFTQEHIDATGPVFTAFGMDDTYTLDTQVTADVKAQMDAYNGYAQDEGLATVPEIPSSDVYFTPKNLADIGYTQANLDTLNAATPGTTSVTTYALATPISQEVADKVNEKAVVLNKEKVYYNNNNKTFTFYNLNNNDSKEVPGVNAVDTSDPLIIDPNIIYEIDLMKFMLDLCLPPSYTNSSDHKIRYEVLSIGDASNLFTYQIQDEDTEETLSYEAYADKTIVKFTSYDGGKTWVTPSLTNQDYGNVPFAFLPNVKETIDNTIATDIPTDSNKNSATVINAVNEFSKRFSTGFEVTLNTMKKVDLANKWSMHSLINIVPFIFTLRDQYRRLFGKPIIKQFVTGRVSSGMMTIEEANAFIGGFGWEASVDGEDVTVTAVPGSGDPLSLASGGTYHSLITFIKETTSPIGANSYELDDMIELLFRRYDLSLEDPNLYNHVFLKHKINLIKDNSELYYRIDPVVYFDNTAINAIISITNTLEKVLLSNSNAFGLLSSRALEHAKRYGADNVITDSTVLINKLSGGDNDQQTVATNPLTYSLTINENVPRTSISLQSKEFLLFATKPAPSYITFTKDIVNAGTAQSWPESDVDASITEKYGKLDIMSKSHVQNNLGYDETSANMFTNKYINSNYDDASYLELDNPTFEYSAKIFKGADTNKRLLTFNFDDLLGENIYQENLFHLFLRPNAVERLKIKPSPLYGSNLNENGDVIRAITQSDPEYKVSDTLLSIIEGEGTPFYKDAENEFEQSVLYKFNTGATNWYDSIVPEVIGEETLLEPYTRLGSDVFDRILIWRMQHSLSEEELTKTDPDSSIQSRMVELLKIMKKSDRDKYTGSSNVNWAAAYTTVSGLAANDTSLIENWTNVSHLPYATFGSLPASGTYTGDDRTSRAWFYNALNDGTVGQNIETGIERFTRSSPPELGSITGYTQEVLDEANIIFSAFGMPSLSLTTSLTDSVKEQISTYNDYVEGQNEEGASMTPLPDIPENATTSFMRQNTFRLDGTQTNGFRTDGNNNAMDHDIYKDMINSVLVTNGIFESTPGNKVFSNYTLSSTNVYVKPQQNNPALYTYVSAMLNGGDGPTSEDEDGNELSGENNGYAHLHDVNEYGANQLVLGFYTKVLTSDSIYTVPVLSADQPIVVADSNTLDAIRVAMFGSDAGTPTVVDYSNVWVTARWSTNTKYVDQANRGDFVNLITIPNADGENILHLVVKLPADPSFVTSLSGSFTSADIVDLYKIDISFNTIPDIQAALTALTPTLPQVSFNLRDEQPDEEYQYFTNWNTGDWGGEVGYRYYTNPRKLEELWLETSGEANNVTFFTEFSTYNLNNNFTSTENPSSTTIYQLNSKLNPDQGDSSVDFPLDMKCVSHSRTDSLPFLTDPTYGELAFIANTYRMSKFINSFSPSNLKTLVNVSELALLVMDGNFKESFGPFEGGDLENGLGIDVVTLNLGRKVSANGKTNVPRGGPDDFDRMNVSYEVATGATIAGDVVVDLGQVVAKSVIIKDGTAYTVTSERPTESGSLVSEININSTELVKTQANATTIGLDEDLPIVSRLLTSGVNPDSSTVIIDNDIEHIVAAPAGSSTNYRGSDVRFKKPKVDPFKQLSSIKESAELNEVEFSYAFNKAQYSATEAAFSLGNTATSASGADKVELIDTKYGKRKVYVRPFKSQTNSDAFDTNNPSGRTAGGFGSIKTEPHKISRKTINAFKTKPLESKPVVYKKSILTRNKDKVVHTKNKIIVYKKNPKRTLKKKETHLERLDRIYNNLGGNVEGNIEA